MVPQVWMSPQKTLLLFHNFCATTCPVVQHDNINVFFRQVHQFPLIDKQPIGVLGQLIIRKLPHDQFHEIFVTFYFSLWGGIVSTFHIINFAQHNKQCFIRMRVQPMLPIRRDSVRRLHELWLTNIVEMIPDFRQS